MLRSEVLVLGAGMVGVCVAAHLAKRGVPTTLVDRRDAGEETSFGNAGLVEASRVLPVGFPRGSRQLLRHAFGLSPESHFHWTALPGLLPFLLRYWANSSRDRLHHAARALRPLVQAAAQEHAALAADAGAAHLLRDTGWLKLFDNERQYEQTAGDRALADELGVPYRRLDRNEVLAREPHLQPIFHCGLFWPRTLSCPDPGALVRAYVHLFERHGGRFVRGDARALQAQDDGWRLATNRGVVESRIAVIALGPWSMDLKTHFGVRVPFAVKRGYHIHLAPGADAHLGTPLLDVAGGYLLVPTKRGIRLTTGVEFARRDAPPTPVQLHRVLPRARELFPLGEPLDDEPWIGSRPAIADSLPVIGSVPGRPDLYLAFGHAHLGFTLGPPTGRLMADLICRTVPFVDPAPFRPQRFPAQATRR